MEPRPQTTIVCDKNECRIARRSAFRVYEPSPQYSYQQMTYAIDRAKSSYALSSAHNLYPVMTWSNGQSLSPYLPVQNGEQQQCSLSLSYANVRNGHLQSNERSSYAYRSRCQKKKTDAVECTVCKKVFVTASTLKIHMRIHLGQKPYKCPHCNKAFAQSGNLITHIRVHTGERPFLCDVCGKRFTQSSSLKTHKKIHKRQEEQDYLDGERYSLEETETFLRVSDLNPGVSNAGVI